MATIKSLGNGKSRVDYYDLNGHRHRPVLPDKEAKNLVQQVCASKFFEINELNPQFGKQALNWHKMKFRTLACKYKEYLLTTRADKNVSYIDTIIYKWGEHRLCQIRKPDFRHWIRFALDNEIKTRSGMFQYEGSSVEKLARYAVAIFNYGIEEELITKNPLNKLLDKKLKKELKRRINVNKEYLTEEEFWTFIYWPEIPDRVRNPLIIIWCTGMREGEACSIKWPRVNGDKISFKPGDVKETDFKTVYMEQEAYDVLAKLQAEQIVSGKKTDWVFLNANGGQLTGSRLSKLFRKYADKYAEHSGIEKFKKITLHNMRDSYTTRKILEGHDIKTIGSNLGQLYEKTTNGYNIVDEQRKRMLTGFKTEEMVELEDPILDLLEMAKERGVNLAELQSEIRKTWRKKIQKNEGL